MIILTKAVVLILLGRWLDLEGQATVQKFRPAKAAPTMDCQSLQTVNLSD